MKDYNSIKEWREWALKMCYAYSTLPTYYIDGEDPQKVKDSYIDFVLERKLRDEDREWIIRKIEENPELRDDYLYYFKSMSRAAKAGPNELPF